jgi:hypothetical protein
LRKLESLRLSEEFKDESETTKKFKDFKYDLRFSKGFKDDSEII